MKAYLTDDIKLMVHNMIKEINEKGIRDALLRRLVKEYQRETFGK